MTETEVRWETGSQLRERVEELATRLVLAGADNNVAADLAALSEMAGASGCPETARSATELAEKIQATGKSKRKKKAVEDLLRDGITRLQQVLENEDRRAADPACASVLEEPHPPAAPSLGQDPELVGDFIMESREHLASIESRMLVLEQNPSDAEAIHSVFRGFHTIRAWPDSLSSL